MPKLSFSFEMKKKREHAFVFYHPKHSIKTPQGPCTYTRQTQLNEYCIYLHSCNVLKIMFSLYWSFCSNVENVFYIWPHYRRKKRMFQKQLKFWNTDVLIVGRKRPVGLNIDLHVIQRCGGTNYKIVHFIQLILRYLLEWYISIHYPRYFTTLEAKGRVRICILISVILYSFL